MPFARPTLTQLKQQVAQDIASALPGADALLRFSNLTILGVTFANLTQLQYGYLDWISLQSNPFTATGEYLEAWAALKNVFRKAANSATGTAVFASSAGRTIPNGTLVVRADGVQYKTTADANESGLQIIAPVKAVADPTGLTGAFGNAPTGTPMTLGNAIAGVISTGSVGPPAAQLTGGTDLETDDNLRTRMLLAYQTISGTGTPAEYEGWALEVAGVTRAWASPNGMGSGTVVVYTMFDVAEAAFAGFPQGTNGVATNEHRDSVAAGDQLAVANFIYPLQGATPLVYSIAPIAGVIAVTINGISGASAGTKAAILAALKDVVYRTGTALGGVILFSDLEAAVASVPFTAGAVITTPNANVATSLGVLPIIGTVTYT